MKHITLIIFIILSFNIWAKEELAEKKTVTVHKVSISKIHDIYKYPVVVEPKYEREIYSEIRGYVENIYVTVGNLVKKGDILMDLKPTGPGYTEKAFIIKSPIDGQVARLDKKVGSYIKPDDLLLHIVEVNDLDLKIAIPQAELKLLSTKQKGAVEFRNSNIALPIIISGISQVVDQTTGTATGKLNWDSNSFNVEQSQMIKTDIYPGMLGYAIFKLNKRDGVVIPTKAIFYEKNEKKIRLVRDNKSIRKTIKLGKQLEGGLTEVLDGLQDGDLVVVSTSQYLKENEKVLVKEE